MPFQSANNLIVALKKQSGLGVPASGAGGTGFRIAEGTQRLKLAKQVIDSAEIRRDGQSTRGRHGSKSVAGAYMGELSVGSFDPFLEAVMRATWAAAVVRTYDNGAALTSLEVTSTSQITQVGNNSLLGAVYEGDLIKLNNMSNAANNDIWLRVTNVTATVITVAGTPLTVQVADIACTLTIARTLVQPAVPVESYWTADEYEQDIDRSILFSDLKFNRLELSKAPDKPIMITLGLLGLNGVAQASGASPVLTNPAFTTSLPLIMADGTIRINGVDYATLTAFNLVLDLGGQTPPVLAPNPPDVFLARARLSGSVSGMRTDFTFHDAFTAETTVGLIVHMVENEANPKDFLSLHVGNAVFDGNDSQPGSDGALVETIPFRAGKDEVGGDHAATMLKISTSAA